VSAAAVSANPILNDEFGARWGTIYFIAVLPLESWTEFARLKSYPLAGSINGWFSE
jgi:hypothetical protein